MADTDTDKPEGTEPEGSGDTDLQAEVEKWKAHARKHEQRAKENADAAKRLSELEDASKSEGERLNERVAAAEARAAKAESKALRYEVAAAKGVPSKLIRFLSGETEEELNEAADELLEAAGVKPDTGDGTETEGETDGGKPTARPQERLQSGAANDVEPEETDPAKLVADIPRP